MSTGVHPDQQVTAAPGRLGRGLVAAVRWYRDAVSPALPPRCRFYPSCSAYAVTALQRYGPARGSRLALRRILRCHPWNPGGVDHVPARDGDTAPTDHHESAVPTSGDLVAGDHVAVVKDVGPQRRPASQETAVA